jgi:hypothetical protein
MSSEIVAQTLEDGVCFLKARSFLICFFIILVNVCIQCSYFIQKLTENRSLSL